MILVIDGVHINSQTLIWLPFAMFALIEAIFEAPTEGLFGGGRATTSSSLSEPKSMPPSAISITSNSSSSAFFSSSSIFFNFSDGSAPCTLTWWRSRVSSEAKDTNDRGSFATQVEQVMVLTGFAAGFSEKNNTKIRWADFFKYFWWFKSSLK